jgi:hypothetical protein
MDQSILDQPAFPAQSHNPVVSHGSAELLLKECTVGFVADEAEFASLGRARRGVSSSLLGLFDCNRRFRALAACLIVIPQFAGFPVLNVVIFSALPTGLGVGSTKAVLISSCKPD